MLGEVILVTQHKGHGEPLLGRPLRGREAVVALPRPADWSGETTRELCLHVGQMSDAHDLLLNLRIFTATPHARLGGHVLLR